MRIGTNFGWVQRIAVVLVLASSVWAQEQVSVTPAEPLASELRLSAQPANFSSSKSPDSVSLVALADPGLLASPSPLLAPAPVIATPTPVIAPRKSEADLKAEARNKKIWMSLAVVNHGAAAFDAWSTRAAIQRGAREVNPLLKPFASSNAMYAAVQVAPFGMDYLGRRMMRSNNSVLRKLWWLPQVASAACSLAAGIHNMGVAR